MWAGNRHWSRPAKKVADQAARPLRAAEARPLLVRLLGGLVVYLSTLYCGPKLRTGQGRGGEGSGLYPELAVLGFSEGSSPALASRVSRLTALLPSYEVARVEFELDERGRMKRGTRPWIDGTLLGADECMELLAMHLHRLGADAAELVVFLSDGAPWIWERLAWVEQRVGLRPEQVVRVLDGCHAVHHVSLALEKLTLCDRKRQQLYQELRKKLRAGQAYQVTIELSFLAEDLPLDSPVWTEIRFLEKHAEGGHLRYQTFRRRGVPLGSGAIESAVRRVVNLRLKGNGIMWYEQNAEGMLALRAAALTGRWQETLDHVRETMARDRRLDWQWTSPNMPAELKAGIAIGPPAPQPQVGKDINRKAA
jgi:hypothetical protein